MLLLTFNSIYVILKDYYSTLFKEYYMKKIFLILGLFALTSSASELIHMQNACDNKIPTACYEFGLLYERGLSVKQDKAKAKAYYLQACEYGFDTACKKFEAI